MRAGESAAENLLRAIFAPETLTCVRGCTYVDENGDEWAKAAKYGELCGSCYWRIRYRLAEAPKIIVALRTAMIPLKAQALEGRVDGTRDRSIPFLESQAPAADEFFGVLVDWATSHAEALGGRPAVTLPASAWRVYESGENSRGLPAWLSPQRAAELTETVVGWLVQWGSQIAALTSVVAYHDDIVSQVGRYRARAGLVAPRQRRASRPCPICKEGVVEVFVPDDAPMVVRCVHCHETFDATDGVAEGEGVAA